ncbi:MAG: OmpH family outer membrane protein [Gemmatimonadetes bacterium]|nr:OmpH family outer membrane protein [Gemmatimonadota bacterium]
MRLPAIVLGAFIALLAAAPLSAQKIGYINSRTILEEAPGAKDARDQFEKEMTGVRGRLQQMEDSLRSMRQQFEQQQLTLTPQAKQQRQDQITQKFDEFQRRAEEMQNQMGRRQDELMQPIMARINQVIEQLRRESDYGMIFDAVSGAFVAADPALDLTSEVIRRLKAMAQAPSSGTRTP